VGLTVQLEMGAYKKPCWGMSQGLAYSAYLFIYVFFFFFLWYWSLNSGLASWTISALLALIIFHVGSCFCPGLTLD
jgi:hypothetical protein